MNSGKLFPSSKKKNNGDEAFTVLQHLIIISSEAIRLYIFCVSRGRRKIALTSHILYGSYSSEDKYIKLE